MTTPRVHALVVGIDRYGSPCLGASEGFEDLDGAVRDARKVHEYLLRDLGLPVEDLRLLTASRGLSAEPREPLAERPGYRQIVAALREMGQRAAPGDVVFFYFSGHGMRVPSARPNASGFDECLVPCDGGQPGGRFLHDVELSFLLAELAQGGVDTVVVLDACFAGGALRAEPRVRVRGSEPRDQTPEESPSVVAAPEALAAFATHQQAGANLGGWLGTSTHHTLLAACAAHEQALEAPLEDGHVGGLFTAALLAALRRAGPGVASYRQLLDRIRAALITAGSRQTPQGEGALDRPFLGRVPAERPAGVPVLATTPDGIRVAAGALHGLALGALFRFPAVGTTFTVFEAREIGDHDSLLLPLDGATVPTVEPGELFGLISPARWHLLRRVRLVGTAEQTLGLAVRLAQPAAEEMRFLRLIEGEELADLRVELDAQGQFHVATGLGDPLGLGPGLLARNPLSAPELVRRLTHWARFESVRTLRNRDSASRLRGTVAIEIDGTVQGATGELPSGQALAMRAVNRSDRVLYVTLLSLGADWSIEALWPSGPWATLEPGQATPILRAAVELPAGIEHGRTTLKACASATPASFDWLALPALLATESAPRLAQRAPISPLDEFLAAWAAGTVNAGTVARSAVGDWTTTEWEVRLHRWPVPGNSD